MVSSYSRPGRRSATKRVLERETPGQFFATVQEAAAQEVVEKASRRVRGTIVAMNADKTKADVRREYMTQSDGIFYPLDAQFQAFNVGDDVVCEEAKGGLIIRSRLRKTTDKTVENMVHRDGSRAATDYPLEGGGSLKSVKAGGIDAGGIRRVSIGDDQVNELKITIGGVHQSNVDTNAISRAKLTAEAVGPVELGTGAVTSSRIATGAVTPGKLDRSYAPPHSHPYASSTHGHGSHSHGVNSGGSHSHSLPSSAGGGNTGSGGSHSHSTDGSGV